MSLTVGIVGLPNVGKTTLFNALTASQAETANYPFTTTESNIGIAALSDQRLDELDAMFKPRKKISATYEFYDIAGLAKGAAWGEGLGNQFLAKIREADAICHIVRCFKDDAVTHVENSIDPLRDIEIIDLELILADLQTVENRLSKVEKKAKAQDKEVLQEQQLLTALKEGLASGQPAAAFTGNPQHVKMIKNWNLLTAKPLIFAANLGEEDINDYENNSFYLQVKEYAERHGSQVIPVCAKIEAELSLLDAETRAEFMRELGIRTAGLQLLIQKTYELLDLATFFTVGEDEVRAWTFHLGMKAVDCAGLIHSDLARGFIKAEVYTYEDITKYGTEAGVKEHGALRIEGREYLVKDGDILFIRFNV